MVATVVGSECPRHGLPVLSVEKSNLLVHVSFLNNVKLLVHTAAVRTRTRGRVRSDGAAANRVLLFSLPLLRSPARSLVRALSLSVFCVENYYHFDNALQPPLAVEE